MRVPLPLTLFAVVALAAGCGAAPGATRTGAPATTAAAPTATAGATATATTGGGGAPGPEAVSCNEGDVGTAVSMVDFAFEPAAATADAADTVTWTNNGAAPHTVTFDNGADCGTLEATETLSVLFNAPGSYPYFCDLHPTMRGTITVN